MAGSARTADVLVLGLGAMGAATLYQLAKRGVKALGVDRFHPPHTEGSSHGGSRVTREAAGEGAPYVPLVQRTHAILHALEAEYGESLLVKSGTLIVGSPNGATPLHGEHDFFATSVALAERFRIKHELLDADELRRRYPQFRTIRETDRGYLEPNSGYIRPEAVIDLQLRASRRLGAETLTSTVCTQIRQQDGIVRIATSAGPIEAQKIVVTAGAWTRKLLGPPFDSLLSVTRQTLHWYEAPEPALFTPGRFPTFIWFVSDKLDDYFSGFPIIAPSEGIKMVASREGPDIDHETIDRHVPAEESRSFYDRHVGPNLAGISAKVTNSASCFYTNTPDRGFIIDTHPDMDKVVVVSACSGHGFKHSVGVGEAVAQRVADGASQTDLSAFRLSRFTNQLTS